jgi:hypothetical protein
MHVVGRGHVSEETQAAMASARPSMAGAMSRNAVYRYAHSSRNTCHYQPWLMLDIKPAYEQVLGYLGSRAEHAMPPSCGVPILHLISPRWLEQM